MQDREKVIINLHECRKYLEDKEWSDSCAGKHIDAVNDALAILKDRTKDYEAWAKEIGIDTCVNCCHASFNRNDGRSTCPIEHNFALVKDGYCHLFMRKKVDTNES